MNKIQKFNIYWKSTRNSRTNLTETQWNSWMSLPRGEQNCTTTRVSAEMSGDIAVSWFTSVSCDFVKGRSWKKQRKPTQNHMEEDNIWFTEKWSSSWFELRFNPVRWRWPQHKTMNAHYCPAVAQGHISMWFSVPGDPPGTFEDWGSVYSSLWFWCCLRWHRKIVKVSAMPPRKAVRATGGTRAKFTAWNQWRGKMSQWTFVERERTSISGNVINERNEQKILTCIVDQYTTPVCR